MDHNCWRCARPMFDGPEKLCDTCHDDRRIDELEYAQQYQYSLWMDSDLKRRLTNRSRGYA